MWCNGLVEEEALGRMFAIKVGPTYSDARGKYGNFLEEWSGLIQRLTDFFLRLNTRQAEIAATIHYASKYLTRPRGQKPTEKEVYDAVNEWKERRRPKLDAAEIASTIRNLAALGWLDVFASDELDVPTQF